MEENKKENENKTNKEMMEHIKAIEMAMSVTNTALASLFAICIKSKETLKLSSVDIKLLNVGMVALGCSADDLQDRAGYSKENESTTEESQDDESLISLEKVLNALGINLK